MKTFLLSLLAGICSLCLNAQVAYVCSGSTKGKYHLNAQCAGLKKCGGPVRKTKVADMRAQGRLGCKICSADVTSSTHTAGGTGAASQVKSNQKFNTRGLEIPQTAERRQQQVIKHAGYTTSYNTDWLIPNWVAYELTLAEVKGTVPRAQKIFEPDPMVKGRVANHYDYSNSGYSRGHMAPAADMKWSEQAMRESFYTINICPQLAGLNGGVWERLENRCRALAADGPVFICCGPIVSARPKKIGRNGVAVPAKFFKVLCMKRRGQWQAVGFVFPNESCKGSMFDYALTVDQVEKLTGHDFFRALPDNIERVVEASWKMKDWQ